MGKNSSKIKQVSDYIGFILNENVRIVPVSKQLANSLPLSVTQRYKLYKSRLLGQAVVLAFVTDGNEQPPAETKKTLTLLENKCGCLAILIAQKMVSYNINRLIAQRVNFIIPQKQMFIPSILVALKGVKSVDADRKRKLPPIAQCIVLYHIQISSLDGKEAKDLERIFDVSYATINRVFRRLKEANLITLEGQKTKNIRFLYANKELWNAALPYLSTPIKRIVFTNDKVDFVKEAGINALAVYTTIDREEQPCKAMTSEELEAANIATNDLSGENKIEIWRYSPRFLSNEHVVDKLSLYLSLKNNADKKVQMKLRYLIRSMNW